ncbi:MAG: flgL [Gemmataceae bacterium]|nr:flgL [Gemmataceae bacterium]
MRVTAQSQANNVIAYMQQQSSTLASVQGQLASGFRIQAPSDDPAGYAVLSGAKASSLQFATYTQTMTDATDTLNSGVSALQDVSGILSQARQLATQGADATTDATGYKAIASQVNGLISRLLTDANTAVGGKYLFGGTATDSAPFQVTATDAQGNPTAISYTGSPDRARALIGPGQTVDTRYVGSQVFQQPGADVFQTLINLRNNLTDPTLTSSQGGMSAALNQRLSDLTAAAGAVSNTTAEQSSNLATLSAVQGRVDDLKLAADAQVGTVGGTDYSSAIVKMQEQEVALQASAAVSAKLLQPNLLSFIH